MLRQLLMGLAAILAGLGIGNNQKESVSTALAALPSLYRTEITIQAPQPLFVGELGWLEEVLTLATNKGWDGDDNTPLPVTIDDFSKETINRYVSREQERAQGLTIPNNLNDLYVSESARAEMISLIRQARREYLEYAQAKGVDAAYLNQINTTVLPDEPDRFSYYPTTHYPGTKSTNVHSLGRADPVDYGQLQMDVYAANIYKIAQEISLSGLLGNQPELEKISRDVAVRYVVYHEMTHVLQQAVDVVNAPEIYKRSLMPGMYASRSVLKIDPSYYQAWGALTDPLAREVNNLTVAKESQAEGVAIVMVGDVFHLSAIQQQALWESHFGPLSQATDTLDRILTLMGTTYPTLNLEVVAHRLRDQLVEKWPGDMKAEPKLTLASMQSRLDGLMASHVGYLHPMRPEAVVRFWDYLKE